MKKLHFFLSSIFLSLILMFDMTAQSFGTGTVGVNLNNFGRVRILTPTATGTRQIDRLSVLFGTSRGVVFDYKQDAGTETAAVTVTSPLSSDLEVMGVINNTASNLPPNVKVTNKVYGWNNGTYMVVLFEVMNPGNTALNGRIGIEIQPQIAGVYGNELGKYIPANDVLDIYKDGSHVGFKFINRVTSSVEMFDYISTVSDTMFYDYMSSEAKDLTFTSGVDGLIGVVSTPVVNIAPGQKAQLYLAIGLGATEAEMLTNVNLAMNKYYQFLPVELTSFTASSANNQVLLNWQTATEINNYGFEIQRKTEGSDFTVIGFKNGKGTTQEPQNYFFTDDVQNVSSGKVTYRLKQIDLDGRFSFSNEIEVDIVPSDLMLSQNYPNPFNPSTSITFAVPGEGNVNLSVYDVNGNLVSELVNQQLKGGMHSVNFNASALSSGVYFYALKFGGLTVTKSMLLMK
ncbi:MAG: T9SS type A sorting domain-containing protein [Ignavibacteriaceae bacterium]|nr:T9SS type A sorting domain-containing protein [Ignavibacteriaceae bacterium]